MIVTRSEVVACAQSYLGVRWLHQGRSRAGVDCVGLVAAIALDLGLVDPKALVIPPYRTRPDGSLLQYFSTHMDRINKRNVQAGSVAIFAFGGSPYHAGIITDVHSSAIIHAYAAERKVVYGYLASTAHGRELVCAFDFKGIVNG